MKTMRTDDLDFELPPHLIAKRPVEPRDSARLLVLLGDQPPEHRFVRDLPELLRRGDALVCNDSAVIPARLVARRESTRGPRSNVSSDPASSSGASSETTVGGRRVEGLALAPVGDDPSGPWRVLLRGSARLRAADRLLLTPPDADHAGHASIVLVERDREAWIVRFETEVDSAWRSADGWSVLAAAGWTPLPQYITTARRRDADDAPPPAELDDRRWYQTVYAADERRGSVAAPTAGLHFTPGLLDRLRDRGVGRIDVTLHVGEGTFRPVTVDRLDDHQMHAERYEVTAAALAELRAQRAAQRRIIAVGSTAARTLESLPDEILEESGEDGPLIGRTSLLIAPPYRFRHLDGLLTNFHLPRSTLLAMVAALIGLDRLKAAYAEAIAHEYRFFSYGDAMLILP